MTTLTLVNPDSHSYIMGWSAAELDNLFQTPLKTLQLTHNLGDLLLEVHGSRTKGLTDYVMMGLLSDRLLSLQSLPVQYRKSKPTTFNLGQHTPYALTQNFARKRGFTLITALNLLILTGLYLDGKLPAITPVYVPNFVTDGLYPEQVKALRDVAFEDLYGENSQYERGRPKRDAVSKGVTLPPAFVSIRSDYFNGASGVNRLFSKWLYNTLLAPTGFQDMRGINPDGKDVRKSKVMLYHPLWQLELIEMHQSHTGNTFSLEFLRLICAGRGCQLSLAM